MKDIPEITGMRGYASQAVIFFHFFTISAVLRGLAFSAIPLSWNSGVDFFFVLSGFLLSTPFFENKKTSLKSYYIRRAFRILPLYYLSLFVTLVFFGQGVTNQDIYTSLFFLQSFNPYTFDQVNGVYWTLVIEEIFYATLPLFIIFFRGNRWMYALPACIAISTFYRVIVATMYGNNLFYENFYLWQYPSYIEHFAIGITIGNLFVTRRVYELKQVGNESKLALTIVLIFVTQYIAGLFFNVQGYNYPLANLIFASEYGALLYFTLSSPLTSWIRKIFTNSFAQFLGKISYSTYVWHLPIEATLFFFRFPLIEWLVASYILAMSLSIFTYYYVEQTFQKLRYRIVPSEKVQLGKQRESVPHGSFPSPISSKMRSTKT
jgi:peptidoglycan/LPS O-acetylase OafA/YrhL